MSINIVIADDHMLLRQGIKNVLELEPDMHVVGEASDGEETMILAQEKKPDIILLDMNMPKLNGLEVTKLLMMSPSKSKVVVLTINDDENYVLELIKAGASGYLLKDIESGMLVRAIRTVYGGEPFIYPELAERLFGGEPGDESDDTQNECAKLQPPCKQQKLTFREIDVVELVCQGMSNQQIAQKLFLSEKTVKNHLTNIFRKLNVNDRTQTVLYAIKNKIVVL
ncbi:DNA-binding NarL/FixJ family response regulator [Sporomusaceae bacterium BoRhaA]|uniref:response regulator n=1 Tax=Pelorhabdus rhamnosifermentans TaxID=2772457 RepID=UPI001C061F25|nr:response regulator transcription factor [Pelorhabdus rhamnosifermentans]MBU2699130.1 DNA-binding NarL/FixJ family response regulator [Pelorhabdus rhamnosifermentans]